MNGSGLKIKPHPVTHTSQVQWGGVPPSLVPAVDVTGRDQLPHAVDVPVLGGIEEGRVPPEEVRYVPVLLRLHHVQRSQVVPIATIHVCAVLEE